MFEFRMKNFLHLLRPQKMLFKQLLMFKEILKIFLVELKEEKMNFEIINQRLKMILMNSEMTFITWSVTSLSSNHHLISSNTSMISLNDLKHDSQQQKMILKEPELSLVISMLNTKNITINFQNETKILKEISGMHLKWWNSLRIIKTMIENSLLNQRNKCQVGNQEWMSLKLKYFHSSKTTN